MARSAAVSLELAFTTFAISISFSQTTDASSRLPFFSTSKLKLYSSLSYSSPLPPPSPSQSIAADLLSLLGSQASVARVDPTEAAEIRSCLRYLSPLQGSHMSSDDEMVLWPPPPILELARLAVDSGGDPAEIQRALDPTVLPVPDVQGAVENKCQLTRTPYGRRFVNKELNNYLAFLFEIIATRAPLVGLNVTLNRYDLFHGHVFLATDLGRLGILFHSKEYPAYDEELFPYFMGYCQKGSNVLYDDSMNLRNILWLAPLPSYDTDSWLAPGVLVVLDAHPNGIIYKKLVPEYVDYVRTIYEDDFGKVVGDVNYFDVQNLVPGDRIFIC